MLEGENIVSAARKAIVRHDFSAVLAIFPILRHLKQTKPEFDQVLQVRGWRRAWGRREEGGRGIPWGRAGGSWKEGAVAAVPLCASQGTAASTKNKLPGLITSMETVGAKALEDFADNIKVISLPLQGHLAVGTSGRLRAGRACRRDGSCQHPLPPHLGAPGLRLLPPPPPHPFSGLCILLALCLKGCPVTCLPRGGARSRLRGVGWVGASLGALPGSGCFHRMTRTRSTTCPRTAPCTSSPAT